ncbi:MAG: hypothetical protein KKC37_09940, partial [Proteobacteria bacterium]|nr:hypothetical protein [Pseudomonadota bacterium]
EKKKPTYFFVTPQGLVFFSPDRTLIEAVIARLIGQARDKLSAGEDYKALVREGLAKNHFGMYVAFPAAGPPPKGRGVALWNNARRMVVMSDLVTWRLSIDLKPGKNKFREQFSRLFTGASGPAHDRLLPASPLIFLGLNGIDLGRQVSDLAVRWPKSVAKAQPFVQAMGYQTVKDLLAALGDKASLGVFGVPRSGLPIPQVLLLINGQNQKAATGLVAGLFKMLVAKQILPPGSVTVKKVGGGELRSTVVPLVGQVGVTSVGPAILVSNHLAYLTARLRKPAAVKPASNWAEARKAAAGSQMFLFIDATRVLQLLPEVYLRLGLTGKGPKMAELLPIIDLASVLRYLTCAADWDGKQRLSMTLKVALQDHQVTKKLSAKTLAALAKVLTGALK